MRAQRRDSFVIIVAGSCVADDYRSWRLVYLPFLKCRREQLSDNIGSILDNLAAAQSYHTKTNVPLTKLSRCTEKGFLLNAGFSPPPPSLFPPGVWIRVLSVYEAPSEFLLIIPRLGRTSNLNFFSGCDSTKLFPSSDRRLVHREISLGSF